jgi:hypothetical protein
MNDLMSFFLSLSPENMMNGIDLWRGKQLEKV